MNDYGKRILGELLDKYERSKSYTGENRVRQNFSVKITDLFPVYADDSEYDVFFAINKACRHLSDEGLIFCQKRKSDVIVSVSLNTKALNECYAYLNRTPKKDTDRLLQELLIRYKGKNELLNRYINDQTDRLEHNKRVRLFDGDFKSYEDILKVLSVIFDIRSETLQRDFSVKTLGDSKAFEKIRGRIESILFEYGDFPRKETVLEELNITRNPDHVYFKGAGHVSLNGCLIDFSRLGGDIGISSSLLKSIDEITVTGDFVMTIENLTSFHAFSSENVFAIYLGGYHNADRREFIRRVHAQNPDKKYLHYGDIDAGGFYILRHLREKTGIDFEPYRMDIPTLKKYRAYTKRLTDTDKKRLSGLSESEFGDVIKYMLENNCKLEQEALD